MDDPAAAPVKPSAPPPAPAPTPAPPKRDAAAARRLPDLYAKLAEVGRVLDRAKADPDVNVHHVQMTISGEGMSHSPSDKKAWAALLVKDLESTLAGIKSEIEKLGFEA